ncbi:hypothetical protein C8J57DRAFT_1376605, partial [Mycena rebaudengoi]
MNFRNKTQLVLLAVVAGCVQMCSGANAGEDGGMCKGHLGILIPLTVCQAECKVVGKPTHYDLSHWADLLPFGI